MWPVTTVPAYSTTTYREPLQNGHLRSWRSSRLDRESRTSAGSRPAPVGSDFLGTSQPEQAGSPPHAVQGNPLGHGTRLSPQRHGRGQQHPRVARQPTPVSPSADQHEHVPTSQARADGHASPYASVIQPTPRSSKPRWQDGFQVNSWKGQTQLEGTPRPAAAGADASQTAARHTDEACRPSHRPPPGASYTANRSSGAAIPPAPHTPHTPTSTLGATRPAEWPRAARARPKQASSGGPGGGSGAGKPRAPAWASPRGPAPVAPSSGGNRRAAWLRAAGAQGGDRGAELQPLQFSTEGARGCAAAVTRAQQAEAGSSCWRRKQWPSQLGMGAIASSAMRGMHAHVRGAVWNAQVPQPSSACVPTFKMAANSGKIHPTC